MKKIAALFITLAMGFTAFSQVNDIVESIHGNFQVDAQYYNPDTAIGAPIVPQKVLSNGFGNINYIRGGFSAGLRYESYNPVMQGFDPRYQGSGVPYRYARYKKDNLDITAGNFYEQFGSGLILRIYEERGLLFDNTIDGFRAIYTPYKGVTVKGLIGHQRTFFTLSPGVVRGGDIDFNINEMFDSLANMKTKIILGGSFVSKYQANNSSTLNQPENVGCGGGRLTVINGGFSVYGEYAYKINDPSYVNKYSFKDGQAAYLTTSYATKGFSALIAGKYVDNMNFRSDRDQTLNAALINYMPALTKYHTYLMAAYYPYATQPNGEMALQGELQYKFAKGSPLGGKYGMEITGNFSTAYGNDSVNIASNADTRQYHYQVRSFSPGIKYFHDANIEINKKFSKKWKGTLLYSNQFYNKSIVQFNDNEKEYPDIKTNVIVLDITYKYKPTSSIRMEAQTMQTQQDKGSWLVGLLEWTPVSRFFAAVLDQWNYANPDPSKRFHYYLASVGFIRESTRITLTYGKQRAGIFCVGGVCRNVPASDGISLTVSTSF